MRIVKNWKSETGNTEYSIGVHARKSNDNELTNYFWQCITDEYELSGELQIWTQPNGEKCVNDFDGAFDLPKAIKEHLRSKGIEVDF
jgi:hypothetical protein